MPKRSRVSALPSCYSTKGDDCDKNLCSDNDAPFVEHHDGRRFWSDRFYLNSTKDDSSSSTQPQRRSCNCGSLEPPPTFPLVDFVNQSLDVKASVMGTFNLHPEWFHQNFPRFGARSSVKEELSKDNDTTDSGNNVIPTFILHGHRGLENAFAKRVKQADEAEYETDREDEEDEDSGKSSSRKISPYSINDNLSSSKFQFFLPATAKATETARHFVNNPFLQLCQVHCNWEKSKPKSLPQRVSSGKENYNTQNINATRETKFGVHHPKFLLLFEQSGDLVVIVTTSNLTPTTRSAVEGSWVQRFRRRTKTEANPRNYQHLENDFGPVLQDFLVRLSEAAAAGPGNSGKALANQGDKSRNRERGRNSKRLPLEEFLWKHIGLRSLSEFSSLYHFETARAYLVPIIPGDYEYNPDDASSANPSNREPCYFYGRQRVRYILDNLVTSTPKISKKTQDKSKSDRLLLQPTSMGNGWSRSQFASLIREYMGYYGSSSKPTQTNKISTTLAKQKSHKKQKTKSDFSYHRDDFWVCKQADIVWPSDQFMLDATKSTQSLEEDGAAAENMISPLQAAARKEGEANVMNSFIFNSSRTFNACDLEFISRMAKFQPSNPCQLHPPKPLGANANKIAVAPHFKSIARLFQNHVAMKKRDVPPADAYFSWFLLTSACLSLGAQGAAIDKVPDLIQPGDNSKNRTDATSSVASSSESMVSYRNFELGVLFASHLPKKSKPQSKTKRLSATGSCIDQESEGRKSVVYCFRPHHCSCGDSRNISPKPFQPELVHLPVPYNLKPESYFQEGSKEGVDDDDDDDDDDMIMNENPFFHEILDGSRCIGNMLLTPFGQRESNQTADL